MIGSSLTVATGNSANSGENRGTFTLIVITSADAGAASTFSGFAVEPAYPATGAPAAMHATISVTKDFFIRLPFLSMQVVAAPGTPLRPAVRTIGTTKFRYGLINIRSSSSGLIRGGVIFTSRVSSTMTPSRALIIPSVRTLAVEILRQS